MKIYSNEYITDFNKLKNAIVGFEFEFYTGKPLTVKDVGAPRSTPSSRNSKPTKLDVNSLATLAKECDEFEIIEKKIFDVRSRLNKVLFPLYVSEKLSKDKPALTSGEISAVLNVFRIKVSQPNCAVVLSGEASKYVSGDKVRRKGQPVRYRILRRGIQLIDSVLKEPN